MKRLAKFLDGFATAFVRRAQPGSAMHYVRGLLSDAKRKNMEGMLRRLAEPGDYQVLQHFITHSTWSVTPVWQRLWSRIPERRGLLLIDDTTVAKQGKHSVGVSHQYCGALGKVANCQTIVTNALRTKHSTWPLAMELFLPEVWLQDDERRAEARIPADVVCRTKAEIALAQIDAARSAGFTIDCVLADAGYGDSIDFREAIAARGLSYSVGVSKTTKAFIGSPRFRKPEPPAGRGRPRSRLRLAQHMSKPMTLEAVAEAAPARAWKQITWRQGTGGPLTAEFLVLRVTPAHNWTKGETHDEVWLICECTLGKDSVRKFYFSNLPASTSIKRLIRITHERWAIEKQYRDLKQEVALDHFEGRSFPGLHRHLVLAALAYVFLELERRRCGEPLPSLCSVRECITEVVTMMLFAAKERFAKGVLHFIQARAPPG